MSSPVTSAGKLQGRENSQGDKKLLCSVEPLSLQCYCSYGLLRADHLKDKPFQEHLEYC